MFINNSFFRKLFIEIDIRIALSIFTFTTVTLVLVISAQIVNIYCRNHTVIKASSSDSNHLIFIGGYMVIIGIIFYSLETIIKIHSTIRLQFCNLIPVLFSVGISTYISGNRLYQNLEVKPDLCPLKEIKQR